jgi:hypothetical protein
LTSAYTGEQETLVPGADLDVSLEQGAGDDEMLELVFGSYLALTELTLEASSVNAKLAKVVFDSRFDSQVSLTV